MPFPSSLPLPRRGTCCLCAARTTARFSVLPLLCPALRGSINVYRGRFEPTFGNSRCCLPAPSLLAFAVQAVRLPATAVSTCRGDGRGGWDAVAWRLPSRYRCRTQLLGVLRPLCENCVRWAFYTAPVPGRVAGRRARRCSILRLPSTLFFLRSDSNALDAVRTRCITGFVWNSEFFFLLWFHFYAYGRSTSVVERAFRQQGDGTGGCFFRTRGRTGNAYDAFCNAPCVALICWFPVLCRIYSLFRCLGFGDGFD